MKKLLATVLFATLSVAAFAQNANAYENGRGLKKGLYKHDRYDRNDDYRGNEGRNYDRYGDDWGYDRDYRVTSGRGASVNSFQRQARERIAQGVANGQLTSRETKRLLAFSERIERKENRYKTFGRLSRDEVRELEADLQELNRMITNELRNGRRAPVDAQRRWF